MPRLDIDTSMIADVATVNALSAIQTHADSNPFSWLDGKIFRFPIKTTTISTAVILFHGLGFTPNIAFSMGILGQDSAGTSFTPVVDGKDTNSKTIKVIVSDPCEAELILYVGRDSQTRK